MKKKEFLFANLIHSNRHGELIEREEVFDFLSAFFIVQVIFLHLSQFSDLHLYSSLGVESFIYFYMPYFFFKSGYFLNIQNIRVCFYGGIKRLLIPFITFSILGILLILPTELLINNNGGG